MEAAALGQAESEVKSRVKGGEDLLTWGRQGGHCDQLQTNPREAAPCRPLSHHAQEGETHTHSAGHRAPHHTLRSAPPTCKSWD